MPAKTKIDPEKDYTYNLLSDGRSTEGNVQVTRKGDSVVLEGYTRFGPVGLHVGAEGILSDAVGRALYRKYPKFNRDETVNIIATHETSITGDGYLTKKCIGFRIRLVVEDVSVMDDREAIFINEPGGRKDVY